MFTNKFYVKVGENVHNIIITNDIYPVDSTFDINNTLDSEPITVNEIIRLASDIEIGLWVPQWLSYCPFPAPTKCPPVFAYIKPFLSAPCALKERFHIHGSDVRQLLWRHT